MPIMRVSDPTFEDKRRIKRVIKGGVTVRG